MKEEDVLKVRCGYCHIIINILRCKDCPRFDQEWQHRINESQYSYCILYEDKPMRDCAGAWFNKEKALYECECQKGDYGNIRKYGTCSYKTISKEFLIIESI